MEAKTAGGDNRDEGSCSIRGTPGGGRKLPVAQAAGRSENRFLVRCKRLNAQKGQSFERVIRRRMGPGAGRRTRTAPPAIGGPSCCPPAVAAAPHACLAPPPAAEPM